MKYPTACVIEIINDWIKARPRGWAFVSANFYIRYETVFTIFQTNQKLWNRLKNLVKLVDESVHGSINFMMSDDAFSYLLKSSPVFRSFASEFAKFGDHHTDFMDCLTYVKRKPAKGSIKAPAPPPSPTLS